MTFELHHTDPEAAAEIVRLRTRVAELEGERLDMPGEIGRAYRDAENKRMAVVDLQAQLERANRAARLHENKLFLLDECLRGPSCPETRISSALTLVRSKVESNGT